MAQELPDLWQSCTSTQQLRRHAVAQPVRMDHAESRSPRGRGDNLGHAAGAEGAMGRFDADEHGAVCGGRRPTTTQIGDHRLTDVNGPRQLLDLTAFPTNDDRAGTPIDVLETKPGDFSRSHAKASEYREHGEIAAPLVRVRRSQEARRACIAVAVSAFGRPASRHPATDGTAAVSRRAIIPSAWRKPSNDRNAVTVIFAALRP